MGKGQGTTFESIRGPSAKGPLDRSLVMWRGVFILICLGGTQAAFFHDSMEAITGSIYETLFFHTHGYSYLQSSCIAVDCSPYRNWLKKTSLYNSQETFILPVNILMDLK